MLLEGSLERIAQAKGAMQQKQWERKGQLIGKAVAIVAGLQGSLVDEKGGELSANLDNLYDYMIRRLTEANLKNEESILDEVSGLILEIKGAWDSPEMSTRSGTEDCMRKAISYWAMRALISGSPKAWNCLALSSARPSSMRRRVAGRTPGGLER
jgi:flagellar protein FliS